MAYWLKTCDRFTSATLLFKSYICSYIFHQTFSLVLAKYLKKIRRIMVIHTNKRFWQLHLVVIHLVRTQNFTKNWHFLPFDTHLCVSGGKKCFFSENFVYVLNEWTLRDAVNWNKSRIYPTCSSPQKQSWKVTFLKIIFWNH